jgi:hypothetical protein
VLAEIDSTFGKGSIMRLGDAATAKARHHSTRARTWACTLSVPWPPRGPSAHIASPRHARHAAQVETFSTGALTLDLALGGGLPRGRIIEARSSLIFTLARFHTSAHNTHIAAR